mmetsp:Transcript_116625/g.324232  ORF Transcript_116625/g.324232 Transcript_116625/m.324232 type:complete len:281 (-) Transcript_116625:125-967(-)
MRLAAGAPSPSLGARTEEARPPGARAGTCAGGRWTPRRTPVALPPPEPSAAETSAPRRPREAAASPTSATAPRRPEAAGSPPSASAPRRLAPTAVSPPSASAPRHPVGWRISASGAPPRRGARPTPSTVAPPRRTPLARPTAGAHPMAGAPAAVFRGRRAAFRGRTAAVLASGAAGRAAPRRPPTPTLAGRTRTSAIGSATEERRRSRSHRAAAPRSVSVDAVGTPEERRRQSARVRPRCARIARAVSHHIEPRFRVCGYMRYVGCRLRRRRRLTHALAM